jgi:hypothetical protein
VTLGCNIVSIDWLTWSFSQDYVAIRLITWIICGEELKPIHIYLQVRCDIQNSNKNAEVAMM